MELTAKNEYDQALEKVSAIEKLDIGFSFPSEISLLKALLYHRMGKYDLAIESVILAYKTLNHFDKYENDDKKYLTLYCVIIAQKAMRGAKTKAAESIPQELMSGVDFSEIDFDKVQKRIKTNFPINRPGDMGN